VRLELGVVERDEYDVICTFLDRRQRLDRNSMLKVVWVLIHEYIKWKDALDDELATSNPD
jgi:hypothetical protein